VATGGVGVVNKKSEIAGYSLFEGTTGNFNQVKQEPSEQDIF
jgi:hypothetical protein